MFERIKLEDLINDDVKDFDFKQSFESSKIDLTKLVERPPLALGV